MIREFSAKAKSSNNNARVAFITLLSLAALSVIAYMLMEKYKGIVGVVTVALITAAVLIYTKYLACEYYYDVTFDYEGTPLLVVRQVTGTRQTTLARIGIAEIQSVTEETREQSRAHKTPYGTRKYVYLPPLSPERTLRITSESPYEKAEIVIEATHEFCELLIAYSSEAKSGTYPGEDD